MLVSDLFTNTRLALNDGQANQYPDALQVVFYNRLLNELNALLIQMMAEIALSSGTITADGSASSFTLPSGFLAFVPATLKPRSPITATANYAHGTALEQIDRMDARAYTTPTLTGSPRYYWITVSGSTQTVNFDCIPLNGYFYDYLYFTSPTAVTTTTVTGGATTPTAWLSLLDDLLARGLEEFCREGLEFTSQKRALWRARTESDVAMVLGLRHLQTQERIPSLWRGMP